MPEPTIILRRYLRRLGWRWTASSVVEGAGLGALVAAGVAVGILGALWNRHIPAEFAVAAILLGGGAVGGIAGFLRRPRRLRVSADADRQLHLPQLLSSAALLPPDQAIDPVDRALRQSLAERAAAICQSAQASRVRTARLGRNAWGALALAVAIPPLLATLAPSTPGGDGSTMTRSPAPSAMALDAGDAPLVRLVDSPAGHRTEMTPNEMVHSAQPAVRHAADPTSAGADPTKTTDHSSFSPSETGSPDGAGTGSGRTASDPASPNDPTPVAPALSPAPPDRPAGSESPAGGVGPAEAAHGGHDEVTSSQAGHSALAMQSPPWQSSLWPAEVAAARRQVDSGQVPARDRDLVRDYFAASADR